MNELDCIYIEELVPEQTNHVTMLHMFYTESYTHTLKIWRLTGSVKKTKLIIEYKRRHPAKQNIDKLLGLV